MRTYRVFPRRPSHEHVCELTRQPYRTRLRSLSPKIVCCVCRVRLLKPLVVMGPALHASFMTFDCHAYSCQTLSDKSPQSFLLVSTTFSLMLDTRWGCIYVFKPEKGNAHRLTLRAGLTRLTLFPGSVDLRIANVNDDKSAVSRSTPTAAFIRYWCTDRRRDARNQ